MWWPSHAVNTERKTRSVLHIKNEEAANLEPSLLNDPTLSKLKDPNAVLRILAQFGH